MVEDEDYLRETCQEIFAEFGYTVHTAANGEEALRKVTEHGAGIHCVLLDLTMPQMDGEETLHELRRIDAKVRVVISSGYTEAEIAPQFAGKPLFGFLQKPYTLNALTQCLRDAMGDGEIPTEP